MIHIEQAKAAKHRIPQRPELRQIIRLLLILDQYRADNGTDSQRHQQHDRHRHGSHAINIRLDAACRLAHEHPSPRLKKLAVMWHPE